MGNAMFADELMLCETDVSKVFDAPGSRVYNVTSSLFKQEVVARAYASAMNIMSDGTIEFIVVNKSGNPARRVGAPFHYLAGDVLCAFKRNKQRDSDSFALNHELFAIEWKTCIIFHFINNVPYIFMSSREEWLKAGKLGSHEELQVFLEVPDYRRLDIKALPAHLDAWRAECEKTNARMG